MVPDTTIRDLAGMEDMRECEAIQKEVWGFFELDVVPAGLFAVMVHYGAVSIGAFVGGRMVAFVSGFPGHADGKPFHHSHMLAVRPEFQGRGIGLALKWAQAERVRAQGISRINWTFDPLQARNANLNINHLGCVASVYRVNVYGESQSPLHAGIPTDRLEPEWWLDSERVARARRGELTPPPGIPDLPAVNRVRRREDGLPESSDPTEPDAPEILFHIPLDLLRVMNRDLGLAMDWRLKSRAGFEALFARGYEVRGFHRSADEAAYRLRLSDCPPPGVEATPKRAASHALPVATPAPLHATPCPPNPQPHARAQPRSQDDSAKLVDGTACTPVSSELIASANSTPCLLVLSVTTLLAPVAST